MPEGRPEGWPRPGVASELHEWAIEKDQKAVEELGALRAETVDSFREMARIGQGLKRPDEFDVAFDSHLEIIERIAAERALRSRGHGLAEVFDGEAMNS